MSLHETVYYPEELLPDEGEALENPRRSDISRVVGEAVTRSIAATLERRPEPKESLPGDSERGASINTTLAV